jgi:uncharacterized protein DUF1302
MRGWTRSAYGSWVLAAVLSYVVLVTAARPLSATLTYGAMQISGNLETQNLARNSSPDKFQFIQNRNTFRLRFEWDWVEKQRFAGKIDVPWIEHSKLFLLYRGVYDGFYDIAPRDRQIGQTRFDDLVGGRITDVPSDQRSGTKFENRLREAYVDLKAAHAPLSMRLGRQQVVWGETDQFRLMDVWNPLDVTWHFQQESWDNIRIPLWLAKGLWDIGDVGPFSNTYFETVYNPFDFQPGVKIGFLPLPWSAPFPDPLRSGQVQVAAPLASLPLVTPVFNLQGGRHGDFHRNPQDASEVGTRLHTVTPQGVECTINYLYGRGRGIGAASPSGIQIQDVRFRASGANPIVADPALGQFAGQPVAPLDITARVVYPYVHIFGFTGNYFEGEFLDTVMRFETAYAMGEPFQTVAEEDRVIVRDASGMPVHNLNGSIARAPLGFTKRDVWSGMIAFDRPTWIRWLNSKATWFLTAQFFWNYTYGNVDLLRGTGANAGEPPYINKPANVYPGIAADGLGTWTSGPFAGRVERLQDSTFVGNSDNIRRWEHLITMAATSPYRGNTLVPLIATAFDPVNMNQQVIWNLDYYYSNDMILTLQQKYYTAFGRSVPSNDPWFAGGRFTRRDETGVKITYQF